MVYIRGGRMCVGLTVCVWGGGGGGGGGGGWVCVYVGQFIGRLCHTVRDTHA